LYISVESTTVHSSPKGKVAQVNRWMKKQSEVRPYDGIVFSLKKERNSDTCYDTDERGRH
jgi:hypothetical protein